MLRPASGAPCRQHHGKMLQRAPCATHTPARSNNDATRTYVTTSYTGIHVFLWNRAHQKCCKIAHLQPEEAGSGPSDRGGSKIRVARATYGVGGQPHIQDA